MTVGGRPDAALVNIVVIMYVVSFLFVMFFYVSEKLRRYYLIFLVLYLAFITKMLVFIWNRFLWNLAPSQTSDWLAISGILIILGFVAGCKLIAFVSRYKLIVFVSDKVRVHFMRKEEDQRKE